jgi:hypothetical protein
MTKIFVWRLTLLCGHLALRGPYTQGTHQKYVGDHAVCDICPKIKDSNTGIRAFQQHLIVKVEEVDPVDCSPEWLRTGLL